MAKIFLFRHAQTTDNLEGVFSGKRDPDLTESGIEEAQKIRDTLKNEKVTKAYSASNKRTTNTLKIVLEPHQGTEINTDPRLRERDYGDLTGKSKEQTAKLYPDEYPKWHRGYDTRPPGGESIKDAEERVMPFIKEMMQNIWQNDVILICVSANIVRPFRKYFEKMSNEEMCSFEHTRGKIYTYNV